MSAPSDRSLKRLFSRAGHPIFVLDPVRDGIRYVNHRACLLLGYAVDELLAMPASALFCANEVALNAFLEAIETQGDGWTSDLPCGRRQEAFSAQKSWRSLSKAPCIATSLSLRAIGPNARTV